MMNNMNGDSIMPTANFTTFLLCTELHGYDCSLCKVSNNS